MHGDGRGWLAKWANPLLRRYLAGRLWLSPENTSICANGEIQYMLSSKSILPGQFLKVWIQSVVHTGLKEGFLTLDKKVTPEFYFYQAYPAGQGSTRGLIPVENHGISPISPISAN